MKNLNLVELLRDCPTGMELDSTVFDNVTFDYVNTQQNRIYCKVDKSESVWFTPKGGVNLLPNAKCVIFPKGKTTWEGFVPPCQFKDGDVITCTNSSCTFVAIFKKIIDKITFERYCLLILDDGKFKIKNDFSDFIKPRLATEEEKQRLFDAIKTNGYKWNAETKTLEKLIVPKFKIGDRIKKGEKIATIVRIYKNFYDVRLDNGIGSFTIDLQDEWELVPNKFDITTLKPFDKVLTRVTTGDVWGIDFFGYHKDGWFRCSGHIAVHFCIPYNDETKHLLGTINDCNEYYKTWEK